MKTSLLDYTEDLAKNFDIEISRVALHNKFNAKGVEFLKEILKLQMSRQFQLEQNHEMGYYFKAVNIKDSSKFSLPTHYDNQYPSFGNFSKKNGLMNIQYEYDLLSGNWTSLELTSIKRNDQLDSKETIDKIAKGELYVRDLGYVTPIYIQAIIDKEAYFINRLPGTISVYDLNDQLIDWKKIDRRFSQSSIPSIEMGVRIYHKNKLECRLIIERVGDQEYKRRLENAVQNAKKYGTGVSDSRKLRCRYNTFITNVQKEILPFEKIRKTYYLRWQIELVFKTWKSFFEINKVKRMKKERMECQLLAKLIWILLNWRLFQTCNSYLRIVKAEVGISTIKFFKRCLKFSESLRKVIIKILSIENWLLNEFLPLIDYTFCEAPKNKTTHYHVIKENICLS
jgi:Transposase DDE domain